MTYEFKNEATECVVHVQESTEGYFWLFRRMDDGTNAQPECYASFAVAMRMAEQFAFGVPT